MSRLALLVAALACLLAQQATARSPADYPRVESHAVLDPGASSLLRQVTEAAAAHGGESGLALLENGADAFAARALTAMRAESTLDIQYYIVHDGLTTRALVSLVLAAAERGVRVRILLDDTASRGNDFGVATLAAHPNIEVRLFNPMYAGRHTLVGSTLSMVTNLDRLHRRMHNKLWIVDNAVAISGGRNLGDEYFGASEAVNFADVDLLSLGPVVPSLSASFDEYWNSRNAVPVEYFVTKRPGKRDLGRLRSQLQEYIVRDSVQQSDYFERLRRRQRDGYLGLSEDRIAWGRADAIWDSPDKVNAPGVPPADLLLVSRLHPYFEAVQREAILVSAYFVPGDAGMQYLSSLRARNVSVHVMTNSLAATDVPFVYGAYADYRVPLLERGVELHEMKPVFAGESSINRFGLWGSSGASLHTKAMVLDDDVVFIGSFNLDPRSHFWNTEVGVVVRSPALNHRLRDVLGVAFRPENSYRLVLRDGTLRYRTREQGRDVELRRPPASLWKRLQSWVSDQVGPETLM